MAKKGGIHESVLHSHRNHLYDPVLNHDRNQYLKKKTGNGSQFLWK